MKYVFGKDMENLGCHSLEATMRFRQNQAAERRVPAGCHALTGVDLPGSPARIPLPLPAGPSRVHAPPGRDRRQQKTEL